MVDGLLAQYNLVFSVLFYKTFNMKHVTLLCMLENVGRKDTVDQDSSWYKQIVESYASLGTL